jgi:glycogen(starch) synthase
VARVLFWSELFWPYIGGAELFAAGLLPGLRERGHELLVVTSQAERDLPDEDELEGIPVRRLPFRAAIEARDVLELARLQRQVVRLKRSFAPDLVHSNDVGPSLLLQLRSRPDAVPWLVGLQQELLGSQTARAGSLLTACLRSASWVAGCSAAVTEQVRALEPGLERRSSTIYNGIEPPSSEPPPPPESPTIAYAGRLVPAKGVDLLLAAIARLAPSFPELTLVVAGDGPLRPELEARARELGVAALVDFRGWVAPAELPETLAGASVVAMPSRREGLPLVAVQAAMAARPIVASCVGGLPEVVKDGETGWLIEPDDLDGLVSALGEVLANPREAAHRGEEGRRRALREFTLRRSVRDFDLLYQLLTGENG